jgi:hypothetical protein
VLRSRSGIIRIHAILKFFNSLEERHEDIHEEDKKKRRERAPLFDAPIKINTGRDSTRESGVAVGISKKCTDTTDDILRNPDMSEESKNNPMVAAIKRLGKVIEEKVVMTSSTFSSEKSFVIVEDVILHDPTRDIAGLAGVNNVGEGENDKSVNGGSNQAIVGIGDDNRSGVLHRTQAFFGEKVE